MMHVQSCCFANINLLLFCRPRCPRCRRCLSSLLLLFPRDKDPFDGVNELDVEDTAPERFIYVIDVSDTVKGIGVEIDR